jgi:hypothetical protein
VGHFHHALGIISNRRSVQDMMMPVVASMPIPAKEMP